MNWIRPYRLLVATVYAWLTIVGAHWDKPDVGEYRKTVWVARDGNIVCGASLVDKLWVLTSASCLQEGDVKNYTIHMEDNTHDKTTRKGKDKEPEQISPKCFIIHPEYNGTPNTSAYDIALIQLERLSDSDDVEMALTAELLEKRKVRGPCQCVVPGLTKGKGNRYRMQKMKISLLPDSKCSNMDYFNADKQICYGRKGKSKRPCEGATGSPLICKENRRLTQMGIHTYADPQNSCKGQIIAGIRMSYFKTWINETITIGCLSSTSSSTTTSSTTSTTTANVCPSGEQQCGIADECFPNSSRCDGVPDCSGEEDEDDCDSISCNENFVACDDGLQCIPVSEDCDGTADCNDGSDEVDC